MCWSYIGLSLLYLFMAFIVTRVIEGSWVRRISDNETLKALGVLLGFWLFIGSLIMLVSGLLNKCPA